MREQNKALQFRNQDQLGQPWSSVGSGPTDNGISSVTFFLTLAFLEDVVETSCIYILQLKGRKNPSNDNC